MLRYGGSGNEGEEEEIERYDGEEREIARRKRLRERERNLLGYI